MKLATAALGSPVPWTRAATVLVDIWVILYRILTYLLTANELLLVSKLFAVGNGTPERESLDNNRLTSSDQRPSGAVQQNNYCSAPALRGRASDRLKPARTAMTNTYNARVHRSTSATIFIMYSLVSCLTQLPQSRPSRCQTRWRNRCCCKFLQ